ncbi:MAG: RNA polymerase sigma factor [Merdibacter sp.]
MRSEQEITRAIARHADTVRRICLLHLKNASDTEDVFQEVFLKYALSTVAFDSEEHEKAWLIRVTINQCKDVLKSFFRRNAVSLDGLLPMAAKQESQDTQTLEAALPCRRISQCDYLHYYEGYAATEIADIMHKPVNTIYTMLARARKLLKEKLGGDEVE